MRAASILRVLMKNLLQTQSIAWAHGVRVGLEAEGIPAVILDEFHPRAPGAHGYVRIAVLRDEDLERAHGVVARITRPRSDSTPPPSWRWQKRGLLLLGMDFVLFGALLGRLDAYRNEHEGSLLVLHAFEAVILLVFITGALFVFLGPRADKVTKGTP
jgi:hypothetical protein